MTMIATIVQWTLGVILILSSLGVILTKNPVHACLSFLMALLTLAAIYLQLSAEFIAVMQVLVYAGAILVIFMYVIVLFQDAHQQIENYKAHSSRLLLAGAATILVMTFIFLGINFSGIGLTTANLEPTFGSVQALGETLYLDFFFPFEAVIMLFLVAVVGALYVGKKVN